MNSKPIVAERMLGALLRIPFQAINRRIQADLTEAGFDDLRPAHFSVFQHLPQNGARATVLAERAQMTKQSMGALLDHLQAGGYIERTPDPTDGRAQIVVRTERGWEVERSARESIRRLERDWGQRLGPERLSQAKAFLTDLVGEIEDQEPS